MTELPRVRMPRSTVRTPLGTSVTVTSTSLMPVSKAASPTGAVPVIQATCTSRRQLAYWVILLPSLRCGGLDDQPS